MKSLASTNKVPNSNSNSNTDSKFITFYKLLETKLSKTGGILNGNIVMNNNSITALKLPNNSTDAASKEYVDNNNNLLKRELTELKKFYLNPVGCVLNLRDRSLYNVSASSEYYIAYSNEYSSINVFNNDLTSEWVTEGVNEDYWIQVEFNEAIRIYKFSMAMIKGITNMIWKLEGSIDGSYFEQINTFNTADNTLASGMICFYHTDVYKDKAYKFYRLFIIRSTGRCCGGLSHLQFYSANLI